MFFRHLSHYENAFVRVKSGNSGVYGARLDSTAIVTGIVKFDLHAEPESGKTCVEVGGNVQGLYDLGHGRFGSKAVFVPKLPGVTSEEDDGYLILFAHDENTGYYFHLSP